MTITLAEDLTFQLGDTGVLLNSDDITFPFVDIVEVDGLDSAPFRTASQDHEGTQGDFMDAEYMTGRDITLTGTVYADSDTMESYLDSLRFNYQPSRVLVPFYFSPPGTLDTRVAMVKPLGVRYNWDTTRRTGNAAIQFMMHAEDPRIYDATFQSQQMLAGTVIVTGRGYNKSYNYGYGTILTTPTSYVLTNNGNQAAPCIITITGPATGPQVMNETTNDLLSFPGLTIPSGQALTIDTVNHTCILNGTQSVRSFLDSPNWFLIQPGPNVMHYYNASGNTSIATVTFRNTWW